MGSGDLLVRRETTKNLSMDFSSDQVGGSSTNLLDCLYGGRPHNEPPHVKKSMKKHGEKVDLILRVDLDELGISEDEFDDLQCLFLLYDHDKDGILNFKGVQKVLKCLGLRLDEEQAKSMVKHVSCDHHGYSLSFNEYLQLVSAQRRREPDEQILMEVFRSFDPTDSGEISEERFRKIMKNKEGVSDEDINEMIDEYRSMSKSTIGAENVILYKEFIAMLQQ